MKYILTSIVLEWEQKGQSKTFSTLGGGPLDTLTLLLLRLPILLIIIAIFW